MFKSARLNKLHQESLAQFVIANASIGRDHVVIVLSFPQNLPRRLKCLKAADDYNIEKIDYI